MLKPIGHFLNSSIKKSGISRQVEASQVIYEFHRQLEKIFGPRILKKAQAKSLKNKVLAVAVLSSVLANELRLKEGEIIKNINSRYGRVLVERLRFIL